MAEEDPRAEEYARAMGETAADRQKALAKTMYRCCGEWIGGPHHEACRFFRDDALPAVIDGQESLL